MKKEKNKKKENSFFIPLVPKWKFLNKNEKLIDKKFY
jgi:hypothetical protein